VANVGFKGVDVRQTTDRLLFRSHLMDASGALVVSGTTNLYLFELQSDATLKSYDFNDNTFKTGALTTATLALSHRKGNNGTFDTGIWTKELTTLTGFTRAAMYLALVNNSLAFPAFQAREFQYGSEEGDGGAFSHFVVGASSTTTSVRTDRAEASNFWNNGVLAFISGANKGLARKVQSYSNTNGAFTVNALPNAPSAGDLGIILGVIE